MQIDLCIERGRVWMPMPQDLGHLCQRSSTAEQFRGERESKQVCTVLRRVESGVRERWLDDT